MADNLLNVLKAAGFKGEGLKTAWAIAKRESGGRADAFNPDSSTGDLSYGLFQINMLGGMGPSRRKQFGLKRNEDLLDAATNARAAYQMSKGGTDWGPWGIGPNAYRKMPALDFSGYPGEGAGISTLPARKGQSVKATTLPFTEADGDNPFSFLGVSQYKGEDNPFAPVVGSRPAQSVVPQRTRVPLDLPKSTINTTTYGGHGSHITDGLDLNAGQKTAVDIMAKPGTAVAAPADGVVLRLGSAQGGESMYFKDTTGRVWWLGHIDGRYSLPAGTRVRRGQTLSRISANHAAPHLHLDRTLAPTDEFG